MPLVAKHAPQVATALLYSISLEPLVALIGVAKQYNYAKHTYINMLCALINLKFY